MLTWEELQRRGRACLRCRSDVAFAGPLSADARERVAEAVRRDLRVEAIRLIRADTRAGIAEAKGTALHLVRRPGECHWCRCEIAADELVDCPRCGSLNIAL